jgi:hypothetical protein
MVAPTPWAALVGRRVHLRSRDDLVDHVVVESHLERYKTLGIVLTPHIAHGLTDADIALAREIDQLEVL